MEKEGRIKLVRSENFFKYDQMATVIGKFTKTPVKVLVYTKCEDDSVLTSTKLIMLKKKSTMNFDNSPLSPFSNASTHF